MPEINREVQECLLRYYQSLRNRQVIMGREGSNEYRIAVEGMRVVAARLEELTEEELKR